MRGAAAEAVHRGVGRRPTSLRGHLRQQRHLLFGGLLRPDNDHFKDGAGYTLHQNGVIETELRKEQ